MDPRSLNPTTVFLSPVRSVGLPSWIHSLNKGHQERHRGEEAREGGWTKSSAEGNLGRGKGDESMKADGLGCPESRPSHSPTWPFKKRFLKQSIPVAQ